MRTAYWRFIQAARALTSVVGCVFVLVTRAAAQTPAKEAVSFDLVITNATIVTMDQDRRVIEGVIAVNGDTIAFVGTAAEFQSQTMKGHTAKQTFDAKGKLIIPGLIN